MCQRVCTLAGPVGVSVRERFFFLFFLFFRKTMASEFYRIRGVRYRETVEMAGSERRTRRREKFSPLPPGKTRHAPGWICHCEAGTVWVKPENETRERRKERERETRWDRDSSYLFRECTGVCKRVTRRGNRKTKRGVHRCLAD